MLVDDKAMPIPYTDREGVTLAKADDFYNDPPLQEPMDFAHQLGDLIDVDASGENLRMQDRLGSKTEDSRQGGE